MNILTNPEIFTPEQVVKIEKLKDATYVCETCLKGVNGDWINEPVAVFANNSPVNIPPGGSRWFGLLYKYPPGGDPVLVIVNAISAVNTDIIGIVAANGDIIYSRFRHDYRVSPDGSVFIDGGRDYTRTGPCPNGMVTLRIVGDELREA